VQYHKMPADGRNSFLDQQIEAVLGWSRVDLQLNGNQADSPGEARAQYAAEFFGQVETWIAAADAEQAPLLSATVRDGVIRWLSTRNLEAEPMGTRQALAERIVAEFEEGLRLDDVLSTLSKHEQNHLSANSLLLIEAWLHQLAAEYEQLPTEQRDAFIHSRLDQVARWELAKLVRSTSSESASTGSPFSGLEASLRMFALINRWILRADEESRPRFEAFMMDLQRQWMSRQMGSSDGS